MDFEARPVRVQLPCVVSVLDDDTHDDLQLHVNKYWEVVTGALRGTDLGTKMCDDCSANPSEPLCDNASEDLNIFAELDYRVLPILRRQLEARLREVEAAEAAVARYNQGS